MNEHRIGYIYKPTPAKTWVKGQKKAEARFGSQAVNPSGDWSKYLPAGEPQSRNGIEPCDCTVQNTLKAFITLSNFYGYDLPKDASARFSAIIAKVRPPGANPIDVAESIRLFGMILEKDLPFDATIKTLAQFYSPDPMDEMLIRKAKEVVKKYDFGYKVLFNDGPFGYTDKKQEILTEELKNGTVCVSVYAWRFNGIEYYKDSHDDDTHWTMLTGRGEEDEYREVDDSYIPYRKRLRWNYNYETAIVYYLQPNKTGIAPNDRSYLSNLLRKAVETLKALYLLTLKK